MVLWSQFFGDKEPLHSSLDRFPCKQPRASYQLLCTLISVTLVLQVLVITRNNWPQCAVVKGLASNRCFEKPRLTTKESTTFHVLTAGAAGTTACNCECNSYVLTYLGT